MIVRANESGFQSELAKLNSNHYRQSALYTQSAANYYKERPLNEGATVEDRSFLLLWENRPVMAFQGGLVKYNTKADLLFYEIPATFIEVKQYLSKKAQKTFLKELDEIVKETNGAFWYQDCLSDGEISTLSRYLLMKGSTATPFFSQIIDLSEDVTLLWRKLRKRYSSLINNGLKELTPEVFDSKTITWELMQEFRDLHIREAGRETRSEESWRRQFEMVKNGDAFVVLGYHDKELVSAGLFMNSADSCYYAVSASRRDLFKKPLFHALMWSAILHSKKNGCHWFEIGDQLFPNHPQDKIPDQKELGISEFKAGFGGQTRMFLDLKLNNYTS